MLFGTIVAVIFWLGTTFIVNRGTSIAPFELLILVINPLLLGGGILVIAWILEGFTKGG